MFNSVLQSNNLMLEQISFPGKPFMFVKLESSYPFSMPQFSFVKNRIPFFFECNEIGSSLASKALCCAITWLNFARILA